MSVIAELSIFPMDKGQSVSTYVKRVLHVIRASGLMFQLNPMGTIIEGDWGSVMETVTNCYKELEPECERIYMSLKIDARKGREYGILSKVAAVE